jgi:fructose-bisphosphate aldolase, class I
VLERAVRILSKEHYVSITDLELTASAIVAGGKGILAADETPQTLTHRFEVHGIASTPESRRDYRELFFTTPGIGMYIGGVILQDETIRQSNSKGVPLVSLLTDQGIVPGIKVDRGAEPLAGCPGECITEGLDGLAARLDEYYAMGARFAKWRAVIVIDQHRPTVACVRANASTLARYAAICQDRGLVPIVEPEVLMDGAHSIERCEEVTGAVLHAVFDELAAQRVTLEGMLLKPNMIMPGAACRTPARGPEVAAATLRCLRRHAPAAIPAIVFLSGGQDHLAATQHLNLVKRLTDAKPWALSFSYGRALQDETLTAWGGRDQNLPAAQRVFSHRARCCTAAARGRYEPIMEAMALAVSHENRSRQ